MFSSRLALSAALAALVTSAAADLQILSPGSNVWWGTCTLLVGRSIENPVKLTPHRALL